MIFIITFRLKSAKNHLCKWPIWPFFGHFDQIWPKSQNDPKWAQRFQNGSFWGWAPPPVQPYPGVTSYVSLVAQKSPKKPGYPVPSQSLRANFDLFGQKLLPGWLTAFGQIGQFPNGPVTHFFWSKVPPGDGWGSGSTVKNSTHNFYLMKIKLKVIYASDFAPSFNLCVRLFT